MRSNSVEERIAEIVRYVEDYFYDCLKSSVFIGFGEAELTYLWRLFFSRREVFLNRVFFFDERQILLTFFFTDRISVVNGLGR